MARNMTTGITRRGVVKGAAAAGLVLSTTGGARAQPLRQSVTAPDFRQATLARHQLVLGCDTAIGLLYLFASDGERLNDAVLIEGLDCLRQRV